MRTKSAMTAAFLAVLALSVNGQRTGGRNNNVDSVESVGCCYGENSQCRGDDVTDTKCARLASRGMGCEWRSGDDADCTFVAVPGCCYSASGNSRCEVDDESTCAQRGVRSDCEWRSGEDADCTVVVEPGCCISTDDTKRNAAKCPEIDAEGSCNAKATRWGCEWRSGENACDDDSDGGDSDDSEGGLTVVCTGSFNDCQGKGFVCPNTGTCSFTCDGGLSCTDTQLYCPQDYECRVTCTNEDDDYSACYDFDVIWADPSLSALFCNGKDACEGVEFPIGQEQMAFEAIISAIGQPASSIQASLLLAGVSAALMILAAAFYVYGRKGKAVAATWDDEE